MELDLLWNPDHWSVLAFQELRFIGIGIPEKAFFLSFVVLCPHKGMFYSYCSFMVDFALLANNYVH